MLQPLQPIYLSRVWHMIKPGIEEIIEEMNRETIHETWIPEDVYSSIKSGQSVLWVCDEGWMITILRTEGYTGLKQVFVWMAYSYDHNKDIVTDNDRMIEEYAKSQGCSMVQFQSNRLGWRKRAKELGYSMGPITYTKRI